VNIIIGIASTTVNSGVQFNFATAICKSLMESVLLHNLNKKYHI
jgi:hypothetical protein